MATSPTVIWQYNDWRQQSGVTAQIARLIQHIQEVEGFVLEASSKGRSIKLQEAYLDRLSKDLSLLQSQSSLANQVSGRFGVLRFSRGDSA